MKLHRASNLPDWEKIPKKERNVWQQQAARTHSVLTPGNALTISGFLIAMAGLGAVGFKHYLAGLILFIIGRSFDILDGLVAEKTGTKSPLGEKLDAGFDKLLTVIALVSLVVFSIIPIWVAALLIIVSFTITLPVYLSLKRQYVTHPARSGKLGMAALWLGICLYVLASNLDGVSGAISRLGGLACFVIALGLSTATTIDYTRQYLSIADNQSTK